MSLASIVLASGHDIRLNYLEVHSTYGGMLEGYPCARINDRKLAAVAATPQTAYWTPPVHLIIPPRHMPEAEAGSARLPFGPVEILPAVYCRGRFSSHPITEELGLYRSYLTVVWFQEDLDTTPAEFVTAAVRHLAWDELAEDSEL